MSISRNIQLLSWFNFFSAFKLYSAIEIIYFSSVTHSFALGLSIFSITQVANALFEIPTGILSDRIGRKYITLLGSIACVLSLIFYASGQSYLPFVIGALFDGLALAFYSGNNDALLFDTVNEMGKKSKYHEYLGKTRSMLYPSLAIAALLGGVLASISFPLVFWLSIIPQGFCVILSLQMVEPKKHVIVVGNVATDFKEALKLLYSNTQLRRLSLAEILKLSVEELLYQSQILFYKTLWPVWAIGLTRSVMAFAKFIGFRLSAKVINRFTAIKTLIINDTLTRMVHIFAILFPSIFSPLFMSSTGVLWGISNVSKNTLLQEQFSNSQRATMSSVLSFLGNLLAGVVAIGIGLFSDKNGLVPTLLVMQLFFIPIILLYLEFNRVNHISRSKVLL